MFDEGCRDVFVDESGVAVECFAEVEGDAVNAVGEDLFVFIGLCGEVN